MGSVSVTPPPPPGFTEDVTAPSAAPPPPAGFTEDVAQPQMSAPEPPPPPPGFTEDVNPPGYGEFQFGHTVPSAQAGGNVGQTQGLQGTGAAAEPPSPPGAPGLSDTISSAVQAVTGPIADVAQGVKRSVSRSYLNQMRDVALLKGQLGISTPEQAAQEYASYQQQSDATRYDPDTEAGLKELGTIINSNDANPARLLSWGLRNPKALGATFGEQAMSIVTGTAGAIGGGVVGGVAGSSVPVVGNAAGAVAGTVLGAGLASGVTDALSQFNDFLVQSKIDPTSPTEVEGVLRNPEMMAKATDMMLKHGVAVGAIDGLTSLLGAKGVGDTIASKFVGEGLRRTAAETAVNTAIEATGGGAGEALGTYWSTGQVNYPQAYLEAAIELPGSVPEAAYSTYLASRERAGAAPSAEELAAAAGSPKFVDMPVKSVDEAIAEGRTMFGFAEEGKPTQIFDTYDQAENVAGQGDLRRGKIIAVNPKDVTEAVVQAPVTPEEVYNSVVADNGTAASQVLAKVKQLDPTVADQIQKAVQKYDTYTGPGVSPKFQEQAKTVLKTELDKLLVPQTIKTFNGDVNAVAVSPKEKNVLPNGEYKTSAFGDIRRAYFTNTSKKTIDLDLYKKFIDEKGGIIVPRVLQHIPQEFADATFDYVTPGAKEEFAQGSVQKRKELFASGAVKMKRLDPRMLVRGWEVKGLTQLESEQILRAAEILTPQLLEGIKSTANRDMEDKFQTYEPESHWIAAQSGSVIAGKPRSNFDSAMTKWLEGMLKKLNMQTKVLLIFKDHNTNDINVNDYPPEVKDFVRNIYNASPGAWGFTNMMGNDVHYIVVSTTGDAAFDFNTLAHEFGHVISGSQFVHAPLRVQLKIYAAYRRFVGGLPKDMFAQFKRRRASVMLQEKYSPDFVKYSAEYALSFEEWFAEQVARYAATDRVPLGMLGRFFREVARKIIRVLRDLRQKTIPSEMFKPELEMEGFLRSMYQTDRSFEGWSNVALPMMTQKSRVEAAPEYYLGEKVLSSHPQQQQLASILDWIQNGGDVPPLIPPNKSYNVGKGENPPPNAMAQSPRNLKTHLDRFNWFYDLTTNFRQLADLNPHIPELQHFRRLLEMALIDSSNIMVHAEERVRRWRKLPTKMQNALTDFLFAMNDMAYLTPQERQRNVKRWPTKQEFAKLAQQYNLDKPTLDLYEDIRDDFLMSIKRIEDLQINEAMRLADPVAQQTAIAEAKAMSLKLLKAPYFPQSRFGKWAVTARNANGKVVHFELFESKGEGRRAFRLLSQDPSLEVNFSTIPQEVQPFTGMPPWLVDKVLSMPGVTPTQQKWLEQLRYELAPEVSFRKRMMKRQNIDGYSMLGRRVYAQYFFSHAKFYARARYDVPLREMISSMREMKNVPMDTSKRTRMADFMEGVFKEFVNPSRDWGFLRSLTAIWHLGFVPASALINMTQVAVATWPFLAQKFGDVSSTAMFLRVAKDLTTYYTKGKLATATSGELKALDQAVKDQIVDESMAAELAAVTSGSMLNAFTSSTVGDNINHKFLQFSHAAMYLFQMTEKWNRRVSFRTAYRLAMKDIGNPWLQEMKAKHFLQYTSLINEGWTDSEALAYLAGKETVQQTHYTYNALSRPKFVRGKKSVLFAFYMFTQGSLYMLWNNKQMLTRYLLVMAALAGPMGLLPDDVEDIINFIARKLMGKDFNLEREARKLTIDMLGENSSIPPDLLLHGVGRYSLGFSHVARMLGAGWVPDVDLSRQIALSRIIPGSPTQMLNPGNDWNTQVTKATEGLAGAGFGIPLNLLKAISATDLDLTDWKRWEGAMPRSLRMLTRSARIAAEGGERDRRLNQYIEYDIDSPFDRAELIAQALGFQTLRQSQSWDANSAEREVQAFYEIRRQMLIDDAYKARFWEKDTQAYSAALEAIRSYNRAVPNGKLAITPDTLKTSFKARLERRNAVEAGRPPEINRGILNETKRLYPETEALFVRPVK